MIEWGGKNIRWEDSIKTEAIMGEILTVKELTKTFKLSSKQQRLE